MEKPVGVIETDGMAITMAPTIISRGAYASAMIESILECWCRAYPEESLKFARYCTYLRDGADEKRKGTFTQTRYCDDERTWCFEMKIPERINTAMCRAFHPDWMDDGEVMGEFRKQFYVGWVTVPGKLSSAGFYKDNKPI